MAVLRVAAVQAAPVLMDQESTPARVADLTRSAAAGGAELVVFPEAFVPGPPVWIDTAPSTRRARGFEGPVRETERIVGADLDLDLVRTGRRCFDPVGHYNRPDVFRLAVDTAPRPAVVELDLVGPPERGVRASIVPT